MKEEERNPTLANKGRLPIVFVGRDTRGSSPTISEQIIRGLETMQVEYVDYGMVTTP
jgi:phosphomannomutase